MPLNPTPDEKVSESELRSDIKAARAEARTARKSERPDLVNSRNPTPDEKIFAYANACAKIRDLMKDATHRRKHKLLVPVGDLNDALMAFGISITRVHNDLAIHSQSKSSVMSRSEESGETT